MPAEVQVGRTDGWLLNDRIRLIGLLRESPTPVGFSYFPGQQVRRRSGTPYHERLRARPATRSDADADAVREAVEARAVRARRDAALTPSQRLERVHELCRQLAAIRPVTAAER